MTFDVVADPSDPRRLSLVGELDLATADTLVERVVAATGSAPGDVVLDLRGLEFVDSTGIRALIGISSRLEGGTLVLEGPTPSVRRVLELVRADSFPNVRIEWDAP